MYSNETFPIARIHVWSWIYFWHRQCGTVNKTIPMIYKAFIGFCLRRLFRSKQLPISVIAHQRVFKNCCYNVRKTLPRSTLPIFLALTTFQDLFELNNAQAFLSAIYFPTLVKLQLFPQENFEPRTYSDTTISSKTPCHKSKPRQTQRPNLRRRGPNAFESAQIMCLRK